MDEHVIKTYVRAEPVFVSGRGATLVTDDGTEYLDFLGGIAVSALGHAHPEMTAALSDQVGKVLHVSNLFRHPYTESVATAIAELSGLAEVFFCNSGAEANEAALKLAFKYHHTRTPGRRHLVALEGGFHGRTLGALSVTHNPAYRDPFATLNCDVTFVPRNDAAALQKAMATEPAALIVEPIQGESGIHELTPEYLQLGRELCDSTDAILIHDEVQSGAGRTGRFRCGQHADVTPDVATFAKPIAAGVPMGITAIASKMIGTLVPGDHGSTFAGGPLACRAAMVVLEFLRDGGLEQVAARGEHLRQSLETLVAEHPHVVARRGRGLMQALVLTPERSAPELRDALFAEGLITNATGPDTLRLLPPYVVTDAQIDTAVATIQRALER